MVKKYILTKDTLGSEIRHLEGTAMQLLTTGQLKKGTIVEYVKSPKRFPLVIEVRIPNAEPIEEEYGTYTVTYQIVKSALKEVK